MPPVAVGDIIQVTMKGRANDQTTLTVFHYQTVVAPSGTDGVVQIKNFADGFDAGIQSPGPALLQCISETWTWESTRAQNIYPNRQIYVDSLVDLPGIRPDTCTAQNVSAVITKRGAFAGRRYIGSTHIPGIASGDYNNGLLTPDLKGLMALAAQRYKLPYTPTLGGGEYRMIIFNRANPALSLGIEATTVQPELRVMRRRTVGLGI